MCGALDPTGAICGPYGEGVGTRVCVGPWLLEPGEKKKKAKPGTNPAETIGWGFLSGGGVTFELLPRGRNQRTAGVSPEPSVRLMTGALSGSRRDSTSGAEAGARDHTIRRGRKKNEYDVRPKCRKKRGIPLFFLF